MGIRRSRASLLVLVLTLTLALTGNGLPAPLVRAQDEAARFAQLLADRENSQSLAGPLSGELVQQEGFSTVNAAGVAVADFSASATFENPAESSEFSWDFGFIFHQTTDGGQQVIVDSAGFWYYAPYPVGTPASGEVSLIDSAPGAVNTIDLVVEGDSALLGVNGEFVTSIALPPGVESDVLVGTGFYSNTTEPGRTVAYTDFEIWPLSAESTSESDEPGSVIEIEQTPAATDEAEETPQSVIEIEEAPDEGTTVTPEREAETTPVAEPATEEEAFALLLDLQEQAGAAPNAGPFNANLKEWENGVAQSWAGIDQADFHARATFVVPEAASETPWDIGLTFRSSPAGPLRIAVDSLGTWYFSIGDQGPSSQGSVNGVVTDAGGENTIDLFVAEQRAVFGVNGTFAAQVELPADATSGDIGIGSGYYSDQTVIDRVTPFRDFTIFPFDLSALEPAGTTAGALAPEDVETFNTFLADSEAETPAVGPLAGRLVESTPGMVSQAAAGIVLTDFGAVASFTNPDDVASNLWDAGIQFRSDGDLTHRVILRSTGEIFAVQPDGTTLVVGTATAYDAAPGAVNELQLLVSGNRALVGVNGELTAVVDLPADPVAADILVGAVFFGEDFVQGRVTSYEGFSVWERV